MRYPNFLKEGGRIGFIAPSFGCASEPYKEQFETALENFKAKGYKTILGPNCFCDEGIGISNTPPKCAAEVNDFFAENHSDVIISCGGGELMCEILPYVDFEKIKSSSPKWFAGYSDNTNLTFLLNILCDTASLYAPCASKYLFEEAPQYVNDAFEVMRGRLMRVHNYDTWRREIEIAGVSKPEESVVAASPVAPAISEKIVPGVEDGECATCEIELPYAQRIYVGDAQASNAEFTGRLIGGCLDCLTNLVGTSFDKTAEYLKKYKDDGFIWFIESCDLGVMGIRRALWQMENAGWFKYVKGFLVGRPYRFDDTFGDFDHYDAVTGILGKYNVPIIMDVDIGHLDPMMPIISGACASVSANGNTLEIEYKLT